MPNNFTKIIVGLFVYILFQINASAIWEIPNIFGDNMVLQRDLPVPVWGWTDPYQNVTVRFKGQAKSVKSGVDGKWMIRLDPMAASRKPCVLEISSGENRSKFVNILVGDIWICSGQSNMAFPMKHSNNSEIEIPLADYPQIHLFKVGRMSVPLQQKFLSNGNWQPCTPKTVENFSAVGFYFGRNLYHELNIPIGLIDSSWPGTRIEPWIPCNGFTGKSLDEIKTMQSGFEEATSDAKLKIAMDYSSRDYAIKNLGKLLENGRPKDDQAVDALYLQSFWAKPSCIYNGMMHALVPYGIKGAIWYQGESNSNDFDYTQKLQTLANSWRTNWQEGDFPFYIVQLAPEKSGRDSLPSFWMQQYDAVSRLKNSGLVSTIDIGDLNDIHPKNKQDVGARLALLALHDTYNKINTVASGPIYRKSHIENNKIVVDFDNAESGLTTADGESPNAFEISGIDEKFYPGHAVIKGTSVIVSSSEVNKPVYVRLAWDCEKLSNFRNRVGLPGLPFNTLYPFFRKSDPVTVNMVKLVKIDDGYAIAALLRNQTNLPFHGVVTINSDSFSSCSKIDCSVLAPDKEVSILIPIKFKQDIPNVFYIKLGINLPDGVFQSERQIINPGCIVMQENVWSREYNIENLNFGEKPSSAKDLSASFSVTKEKDGIVLRLRVKDDIVGKFTKLETPWEEDCVELFLDINPLIAKGLNPAQYTDSTYQILISPHRNTVNSVYCDKPFLNGLNITAKFEIVPDGYESIIRIDHCGADKGKCIGIELAVDDSDGMMRKTQLVWRTIGANNVDRSRWSLVTFE